MPPIHRFADPVYRKHLKTSPYDPVGPSEKRAFDAGFKAAEELAKERAEMQTVVERYVAEGAAVLTTPATAQAKEIKVGDTVDMVTTRTKRGKVTVVTDDSIGIDGARYALPHKMSPAFGGDTVTREFRIVAKAPEWRTGDIIVYNPPGITAGTESYAMQRNSDGGWDSADVKNDYSSDAAVEKGIENGWVTVVMKQGKLV
jgi:hypothetical protein